MTRKITYKSLEKWFEEAREIAEIPTVCIANKIDFDPSATQRR